MTDPAKGKGREPFGREGLLWSDVYEHLGLAGQTCPLAVSPQNAVVFSPSSQGALPLGSSSSPRVSLQCYPIDNAEPSSTGARNTFAIPLPSFALPHLPATHLSFSPASDHFVAFFPLAPSPSEAASCSAWNWAQPGAGEGGTLALWALTGDKGRSPNDWKLQESWACPQGDEVIDVAWLGAPRRWTIDGVDPAGEGGSAPAPATFARRARCGPPLLPSQHPTFLVLSAAHKVTLYHPPSSSSNATAPALAMSSQQAILRTTRCTVDGPGTATWGVMSDSNGSDDARRRWRRIRRGRFYTRTNDESIYLALHSTIHPAPPPVASVNATDVDTTSNPHQKPAATGTAEILAGLGIDVDLPNLTANTPMPDASAADGGSGSGAFPRSDNDDHAVACGDEDFVEVVEISVDFLVDDHTTLSTQPYPAIPLSSSFELSASAIVTDLVFAEPALSSLSSPDATGAARSLGLVVAVADLAAGPDDHQPGRPVSELHQWRIDKNPSELSRAFSELEAASAPVPETAEGSGNETAMFVQSRVFPRSVLAALRPAPGTDSLVVTMEIFNESWDDGNMGCFQILDFATLQDSAAAAPLRNAPLQGHHVPTVFAATANASFLALFNAGSSSINFHLHPALADVTQVDEDAQAAGRLGRAIALALHQGTDVQDLIKILPLRNAARQAARSKRKRESDLETAEAVIAACWQTLDRGTPPGASLVGKSRWILLLVQLQRALYRSVGSARQQVAEEILNLATHNGAFERCYLRPKNGGRPQYQLDAAFRLIRETEQSLEAIHRLLLSPIVDHSWASWGAKDSRALPCHFLISHPTTRALLSSLATHIQTFATFFATVQAPLAAPAGALSMSGPSLVVTDMAKGVLADICQKAALIGGVEFGQALERIEGILPKAAPTSLANSTLLRLDIPADATADTQTLSQALASLPSTALDQAALFRTAA